MIRDAVKFIGAVQFITITIGRCCLEYFDQLLVLAPVMVERIKKRHYDGVGYLDALLVILPKANLKQILQEFRSILSWGFYFTLLQLDEQLVDLYYKRCEEAVGFLVKRDADGYCRCIQQVYMQLFHIIIHCAKRIGIRQCDAIQLPDIDSLPLQETKNVCANP